MRVQGIDYAYTIQGWLKSVNGDTVSREIDMGKDGLNTVNATDAIAFTIDYFQGDYKPAHAPSISHIYSPQKNLYNGNIAQNTVDYGENPAGQKFHRLTRQYLYDQMSRLQQADNALVDITGSLNQVPEYRSRYSYDLDGNLSTLVRYATDYQFTPVPVMDSFHYFYGTGTDGYLPNQLKMLNDSATIDRTVDIAHNTSTMPNFYYDLIGNLTKDLVNGQDTINWNLYNKVDAVANVNGSSLAYEYDAQGNRVGKKYTLPDGNEKSDYYLHDAQGHTLAVYHHNKNYDPGGFAGLKDESFSLAEHYIYGSNRLGVRKYWEPVTIDTVWHAGQIGNTWDYHNFRFDTVRLWERKPWYSLEYQDNIVDTARDYIAHTFTENSSGSATTGQKMYELTDHLGNVLATVSDKRFPMSSGSDTTTIAYYTPVLHSIQDYYPFGMPMPGQTWESSNSDCQNVTQTALMPIHNYVEITALNSDFLSILGASLTTAPLAFKVTATPPNQGFSYNIAPVVPNLAQQIKIYFHAPTPFILNYKVAQSGCSLPMNTIPPGTKNYTIYFTPCNLNAIQLSITAPSVFATTTIVIDSIVKDSISFTPELVITKVCDEGVYEYGFNGKLKDDEWAGKGNHSSFEMRELDTRIARFLSNDPMRNAFPYQTPYCFAGNSPIAYIDFKGAFKMRPENVYFYDDDNKLHDYRAVYNFIYDKKNGLFQVAASKELLAEMAKCGETTLNESIEDLKPGGGGFIQTSPQKVWDQYFAETYIGNTAEGGAVHDDILINQFFFDAFAYAKTNEDRLAAAICIIQHSTHENCHLHWIHKNLSDEFKSKNDQLIHENFNKFFEKRWDDNQSIYSELLFVRNNLDAFQRLLNLKTTSCNDMFSRNFPNYKPQKRGNYQHQQFNLDYKNRFRKNEKGTYDEIK